VSVLPADFPPSPGRHEWRPLHVRYGGETFHGWWYSTGIFVRTLVAAPQPLAPTALAESSPV
jgi:hypothetical protein